MGAMVLWHHIFQRPQGWWDTHGQANFTGHPLKGGAQEISLRQALLALALKIEAGGIEKGQVQAVNRSRRCCNRASSTVSRLSPSRRMARYGWCNYKGSAPSARTSHRQRSPAWSDPDSKRQ